MTQRPKRFDAASFSSDDEDSEVVSSSFNGTGPLIDAAHVPKKLWRHTSIERCANLEAKDESKVLVLYTGGTIGMMRNENGALVPISNALERMLRKAVHLHDEKYATVRFGAGNTHKAPLALPSLGPNTKRILYTIYEYEPLLDSSNMTMDDWINIAKDLRRSYELFDGFVILHGTDTLSYTASALSFMLENLGKTVIVTGSQIPIFEIRSDGRDNFLGALIVAGTYCIPEVCVFFNHKLYRGNRTVKRSNGSLDAFDSPNRTPLAQFGIDVHVDYRSIFRPMSIDRFRVHSNLNRNVCLLRLFPSITIQTVRALLHPPIEGIVLQTYGSGNVPSNRHDLVEELKQATAKGVLIINTTQCCHGSVQAIYETGAALMEAGVIPGADMTPEAALTKLSYVLSKDEWDLETKRKMMMTNLRGELTIPQSSQLKEMEIVEAVARSLHLSSSEEMEKLKDVLFPSLILSAIKKDDLVKLEALEKYGANLSACDSDGRTPLHTAAQDGRLATVEFLLGKGASVHSRDRSGNSPLMSAVLSDHHAVIEILVQCGAHLTIGPLIVGEMLCSAAARGNIIRLVSLTKAGADLNQTDISSRCALHLAAQHSQDECVKYLLKNNALTDLKDDFGMTPMDVAEKLGRKRIAELLGQKNKSNSNVSS